MKCSAKGITFVENQEGFRAQAYLDEAGWWTIGYGEKLGRIKPKLLTTTEAQAETQLKQHLIAVETYLTLDTPFLKQNEFDALCSLLYNVGAQAYAKSAFRILIKGKTPIIKLRNYWLSFCHYEDEKKVLHISPGLEARRVREFDYAIQKPSVKV